MRLLLTAVPVMWLRPSDVVGVLMPSPAVALALARKAAAGEVGKAVEAALLAGYRMIDCAACYQASMHSCLPSSHMLQVLAMDCPG